LVRSGGHWALTRGATSEDAATKIVATIEHFILTPLNRISAPVLLAGEFSRRSASASSRFLGSTQFLACRGTQSAEPLADCWSLSAVRARELLLWLPIGQMDRHPLAKCMGSACEGAERYGGVCGIEQPIQLSPAGVEFAGKGQLCLALFLHRLFQLPGDDSLNGGRFHLLADSIFFKEAAEARTAVVESGIRFMPSRVRGCSSAQFQDRCRASGRSLS